MIESLRFVGNMWAENPDVSRMLSVYQMLIADSRTPRVAKLLLTLALWEIRLWSPAEHDPNYRASLGDVTDTFMAMGLILFAREVIPSDVMEDLLTRNKLLTQPSVITE